MAGHKIRIQRGGRAVRGRYTVVGLAVGGFVRSPGNGGGRHSDTAHGDPTDHGWRRIQRCECEIATRRQIAGCVL